jgi:hypothetical protein
VAAVDLFALSLSPSEFSALSAFTIPYALSAGLTQWLVLTLSAFSLATGAATTGVTLPLRIQVSLFNTMTVALCLTQ